jgi:hypothetical protein
MYMNTTSYCPCCKRRMPKPRVEKMTPQLAKALAKIHSLCGTRFEKIPAYVFKAQHSRLKHWGFLEEEFYVRKDGSAQRRPGVWRVTDAGEEWLAGRSRVPFELHLEKDRVILAGDILCTYAQVLGLEETDEPEESDYDHYMRETDSDEE